MSAGPQHLFPGNQFVSTILESLETKTQMSGSLTNRYLQRAAMAGILIGVLYGLNFAVIAAFDAVPAGTSTLVSLGRLAGAVVFGWALVFIYYTKSELLTSNMMIVSIGWYYRRSTWLRSLRLLGLCYLGNALGGLFVAALLRFSTIADGGTLKQMEAAVKHKLDFISSGPVGWGDLFVRAILCNFMINLAMLLVYTRLVKDELIKTLVIITSVFTFMFLGFDHSVANTVLFSIVGLKEGIDLAPAAANLGIALLGNFVGGGLLIGVYYAYLNDDAAYLRAHPPAPPDAG
jgi:formate/nitrite transporter FocA (FNT family)